MCSGEQFSQGDPDIHSTTSAKRSQEFTDNSPLEFAPFIPSEPSQFECDPGIYDSLLSPTRFEWDMANMWMPDFALDSWASADPMESNQEADII
jgi:hypothetical protein